VVAVVRVAVGWQWDGGRDGGGGGGGRGRRWGRRWDRGGVDAVGAIVGGRMRWRSGGGGGGHEDDSGGCRGVGRIGSGVGGGGGDGRQENVVYSYMQYI